MLQRYLKSAWRFLARLKVAATLIAIVLLLSALGSCFPQVSAGKLAGLEPELRGRYGGLTGALLALGVFRLFGSPVFFALTGLLALCTTICTVDRWGAVWRRAFREPAPRFDAAPCSASFGLPPKVTPGLALCEASRHLEGRGFDVQHADEEDAVIRAGRGRLAALATLVTHVALLLMMAGVLLGRFGWREELTVEPGGTEAVSRVEGLEVRNDGFTIERYPDGGVSDYRAEITLLEDGREAARRVVRVNAPCGHGGVGFHLSGYAETVGGYRVVLLAERDPGYGMVVVAGFLLLAGMVVSFNFPHCRVYARVVPGEKLQLAGFAGRYSCGFEREFEALVLEIECALDARGDARR